MSWTVLLDLRHLGELFQAPCSAQHTEDLYESEPLMLAVLLCFVLRLLCKLVVGVTDPLPRV